MENITHKKNPIEIKTIEALKPLSVKGYRDAFFFFKIK